MLCTISAFQFNDYSHLSFPSRWSREILSPHVFRKLIIYWFNIFARCYHNLIRSSLDIYFKFKIRFWLVWQCDGFFLLVSFKRFAFQRRAFILKWPLADPLFFFRLRRLFRACNKQCPPSRKGVKVTRPLRVCPRFVPHFCGNYRMLFEHHMSRCRSQFNENSTIKLMNRAR